MLALPRVQPGQAAWEVWALPQLSPAENGPGMSGAVHRAAALTLAFLPFPPARKPKWSFTMNSPNPSN